MTYPEINGTGLLTIFEYTNTVTNNLAMPLLLNIAILPILVILLRLGGIPIKKALTGAFFVCGVLSILLWSAGLLAGFWPFVYFIALAVSLAF